MLQRALRSGHYVVTDNFGSGKLGGSGGAEEAHEVLENELALRLQARSGGREQRVQQGSIG